MNYGYSQNSRIHASICKWPRCGRTTNKHTCCKEYGTLQISASFPVTYKNVQVPVTYKNGSPVFDLRNSVTKCYQGFKYDYSCNNGSKCKGSPHLETEGCKVHPEFPDLLYFIMHAGGVC